MDFLPADPSIGQKYKINSDSAYYYEWNGFAWETFTESPNNFNERAVQKIVREVVNETPSGIINSINNIFELVSLPEQNSETLYLNGILQKKGDDYDYVIEGSIISFNFSPLEESVILCSYSTMDQLYNKNEEPVGIFDGSNRVFSLSKNIVIGYEKIYLNGILQKYGNAYDYIIEGTSVIFNEAPPENSTISCYYYSGI